MQIRYLFYSVLLILMVSSCTRRNDCPNTTDWGCANQVFDSKADKERCECVCTFGSDSTTHMFRSPLDDLGYCWWESRPDFSMDYEIYGFDHLHVRPDGFTERVLGTIQILYDRDGSKLTQREDIPYQSVASFNLRYPFWQSCYKNSDTGAPRPFYMKENKRDTLFMDLLVGYYFPYTHVICGDFYYTKSYMVRREEGLDWYSNLYSIPEGADGVDILFAAHNDEIEPDTTFFIHMPRLFQKG
jgi:hypothetical protein